MELDHEPNKKPYRSVWSNALWSLQGLIRGSPAALMLMLLEIPLAVFLAWGEVRLPALVVGQVTQRAALKQAAVLVGGFLLLMLGATVLRDTCDAVLDVLLKRYRTLRSVELDRKTMECPYELLEQKETRDLQKRAQRSTWMWNDVQPISDVPRRTLKIAEYLLCYILLGTVLSGVSPWLVLLLTVMPMVNLLCGNAYRKWQYASRPARADLWRKLEYVCRKPADFAAWKDIRVYSMAQWFRDLHEDLLQKELQWSRRDSLRVLGVRLGDLGAVLLRDGAAYAVLIAQAVRGMVNAEQFVLYFAAISSFAGFVGNLITEWSEILNASLYVCDFREYLDLPEGPARGTERAKGHLDHAPEICLEHVSYRYPGAEQDTIHDVNLTLHAGERVALVGLNGAGKTTLAKLITGLYTPTGGRILVDGVPAAAFPWEEYFKLFSPVFQDTQTGPFTILETVSSQFGGRGDAAWAEQCLRQAGLGEKLDTLPRGMDTALDKLVDSSGTDLSGGEKQKLMLARAIYKNAPVLVLDEPTAALDPIAENGIYLQYSAMTQGKTALFISHRLASTRFCDCIVFLQNGRIVELGTHEELSALGGEYSRLFALQSCWYQEDCTKEGGVNDAV